MSSDIRVSDINPLSELTKFLREHLSLHPGCSKDEVEDATAKKFGLTKERSVYVGPDFAIRFSTANTPSFSNVVLSLSALKRYDSNPFIVCVVRQKTVDLFLANSTFLKKISHSSQQLRVDNVKGSFLGHDILRVYENIPNIPENFDRLFSIHREFTWEENLARLVESTNNIVPTGVRFTPTQIQRDSILRSPQLAQNLSHDSEYLATGTKLSEKVNQYKADILKAAKIPNINTRGNQIEQIITEAVNAHGLEDIVYTIKTDLILMIDVKTKMLNLSSSPKAYNVDKVLKSLASGNTTFSFFFIGIDLSSETLYTRLVSIFDSRLLKVTNVVFHWAGRNSRGVTQLSDLSFVFSTDFEEEIDISKAEEFLRYLLDLRKNDNEIDASLENESSADNPSLWSELS